MPSPAKVITLRKAYYRQRNVMMLRFNYDAELTNRAKQLDGCCWSRTMKSWYIPVLKFDLQKIRITFKDIATIDLSRLDHSTQNDLKLSKRNTYSYRKLIGLPEGFLELLKQKRYSDSTISTYSAYLKDFIYHFKDRDLQSILLSEINGYILSLIQTNNISGSEQNQRISNTGVC